MKIFEKITKKDLTYFIIILTIILIAVICNFLGNDKGANDNINFAATIVSIVLGVIAILYTLMDSTGQKESIATLINVSTKLEKQINLFEDSIKQNIEIGSQIDILRTDMQNNNEKLLIYFESLNKKVDSGDLGEVKKEVQKISQELESRKKKTLSSYGIDTNLNKRDSDGVKIDSDLFDLLRKSREIQAKFDFEE